MNILKFLVLLAYALLKCDCRWVLEVEMESYRNEESKAIGSQYKGLCCDLPSPLERECSNECDNYFVFCLQATSEIGMGSCEYGQNTTDVIPGGDDLTFQKGTTLDGSVPNPLVFSNDQWPHNNDGTLNLLIFMYDFDSISSSDLVGSASLQVMLTLEGTSRRVSITGQYYQIYLEYSSKCALNYYGPDCSKYCMPRDDSSGHYTCSTQGNIVCLPGYHAEEINCIAINTCEPECDGVHSYCTPASMCKCYGGWKGNDCETPVCYQDCNGRGDCIEPGICECFKGWNGTFCNNRIDGELIIAASTVTGTVSNSRISDETTIQGELFVVISEETSIVNTNSISLQNISTTVGTPRTSIMARNDNKVTNYKDLTIGLATFGGVLLLILAISVSLIFVMIFIHNKNHRSKNIEHQDDVITPGDNPNYSVTMMRVSAPLRPAQEAVDTRNCPTYQRNNSVQNLENPTYTPTSNENQFIVSGYSLVSLSEDQTASIYHSNADGLDSSNDTKYSNTVSCYDRTSHVVKKKKPASLYYSQPVLNEEPTAEYDYAEASSGVNLIDKEISSSERKLDKKSEKDLKQLYEFNKNWNII